MKPPVMNAISANVHTDCTPVTVHLCASASQSFNLAIDFSNLHSLSRGTNGGDLVQRVH
jgi:hypothetical protein